MRGVPFCDPATLFGIAQGVNLPNVFSLLNSHAPNENRGAFMATNGMSLRTGQTMTVLRGKRDRFAFGALVAGFAAAVLLNVVSPDALVARVNIARLEADERFDPYYLTFLSADAVPVLVESFPDVGDTHPYQQYVGGGGREARVQRGPTLQQVVERQWKRGPTDWRSWNLSRFRAERLVEDASEKGR